ncbi:unnamed protein product [Linum tenue]|uniref:Uncharacterized protein n=1 Tax=Linum tenue TaxID=586396 RepID=A0AAV0L116_9ROSI|nr:unnamed protein product [Linum tenue]
MNPGSRKI